MKMKRLIAMVLSALLVINTMPGIAYGTDLLEENEYDIVTELTDTEEIIIDNEMDTDIEESEQNNEEDDISEPYNEIEDSTTSSSMEFESDEDILEEIVESGDIETTEPEEPEEPIEDATSSNATEPEVGEDVTPGTLEETPDIESEEQLEQEKPEEQEEKQIEEKDNTAYIDALEADSIGELNEILAQYTWTDEGIEMLFALSKEQLEELHTYANYLMPEEHSEMEEMDYDDVIYTLQFLMEDNGYNIELYVNKSGTIGATTISSNTTWDIVGNVTLTGTITINSGATLTVNGNYTITRNFTSGAMFRINAGGTLVINGVTLDGANRANSGAAIWVNGGTLRMDDVTIKNCNRTSGMGGGIQFGYDGYSRTVNVTINDSTLDNCKAGEGAAIIFHNTCSGNIVISNTTVSNCESTGTYGGTLRTQGNFNASVELISCKIKDNISIKNGGGVYWNARGANASLEISGTASNPTIISGNTAENYGGGLHLAGQSINIEHTEIINNSAPNGGGICLAPYDYTREYTGDGCNLTLGEGAVIESNMATQYGGGILMRVYCGSATDGEDFTITINDGAIIKSNNATYGGAFAIKQNMDAAEDSANNSKRYNTYVYINGGTIGGTSLMDGNIATNGGAFYISRDYGDQGSNYDLEVYINGGSILHNRAGGGGAIYFEDNATNSESKVSISDGNMEYNTATVGGAIYVNGGNFNISGGDVLKNEAKELGGAIAINNGNFHMSGGNIDNNNAHLKGGAVYVEGGDILTTGGSMSSNLAQYGGALYVKGGNTVIQHGSFNSNEAEYGGAIYIDGEVGTSLKMTSGQINNNTSEEDGGGIYVTNGNLYIGIEGCTEDNNLHSAGKHHPQIQNNTAGDCGGGISIANQGVVYFYCGDAVNNRALYKGVGMNVFMDGGEFHLYDGACIGIPRDPDLVIIGGELYDECEHVKYIKLHYYNSNKADVDGDKTFQGLAEIDEYMNLPDGEYFWDAPEGYRFFGWTPYGPNSGMDSEFVRDKDDYKPSGVPVIINDTFEHGGSQGTYDGTEDETMHLYALWAPIVNNITYIDGLTYTEITGYSRDTYTINEVAYDINIGAQAAISNNPGFKLVGWYLFQDEGQSANWGLEPYYKNGVTRTNKSFVTMDFNNPNFTYIPLSEDNGDFDLTIDELTFGDITLIADYELEYGTLEVERQGANTTLDSGQTFVYDVVCKKEDTIAYSRYDEILNEKMKAQIEQIQDIHIRTSVAGDKGFIVKDILLGYYDITENQNWSWRYDAEEKGSISVLGNDTLTNFYSQRSNKKWMDYNSFNSGKQAVVSYSIEMFNRRKTFISNIA